MNYGVKDFAFQCENDMSKLCLKDKIDCLQFCRKYWYSKQRVLASTEIASMDVNIFPNASWCLATLILYKLQPQFGIWWFLTLVVSLWTLDNHINYLVCNKCLGGTAMAFISTSFGFGVSHHFKPFESFVCNLLSFLVKGWIWFW